MRHTTRNLSLLGLGLGVSTLVGWLLFREHKRNKSSGGSMHTLLDGVSTEVPQIVLPLESMINDEVVISSRSSVAPKSGPDDDLTRIRDIGPKFAEALRSIGITRFSQLAEESPDELASKLNSYVSVRSQRIHDNDWIGQARRLTNNAHS